MKEERIKFFEKTDDLRAIDAGLDITKSRLERVLSEWRQVTDGAPLTMATVTDFTTVNFLGARLPDRDKIEKYVMTEKVRHSPLFKEIDLDALIKITTKRPEISGLVEAVKELCGTIPSPLMETGDQYRPACFRIDGDAVEMIPEQVEQVRSKYIAYATNTEERHRLKLVQAIIDAYNELRQEYDVPLNKFAIYGLVAYDAVKETLFPSPDFVKDGRVYSGNYMGRASTFKDTAPTIGDIRSQVPLNSGYSVGETDAIKQIAEKRNRRITI